MNSRQNKTEDFVPVAGVEVKCFAIPTDTPESDGTLKWDKTLMVYVEISGGGKTGIGYTYADQATAHLIRNKLAGLVTGGNILDIPALFDTMYREIRNLGNPGICSMAISAMDIALWDLKCKLLDLPLVSLLGRYRESIPVYGSGGFTSYDADTFRRQFESWLDEGFFMFKMKVGRQASDDVKRVEFARKIIGENNQLFVDGNGAYSVRQAYAMARDFANYHVTWFEEPVSSDDLEGLLFLRHHVPPEMNIAAGEYGYDLPYFHRMLDHHAVDVLQVDSTRCGGVTGFLKAAVLCEAFQIPLSAHTVPSVHSILCCSVKGAVHVEYFHDHARIEKMFFDGFIQPVNGKCTPSSKEAGLGLSLKEKDSRKYLVS